MSHKYWQKVRLLVLCSCSLSVFLTLGFKLLAKPSFYKFPEHKTLSRWESIKTNKIKYDGQNVEGKRYLTKNTTNKLIVEVYYLPNHNRDNQELIQQYLSLKSPLKNINVIDNKNFGSYGIFVKDRKAILTTCISPQGKTAFTSQQFANLANQNMRQRLLPWFLGLSDLRDWRCYWVNMSVSGDRLTKQEAASILQRQLQALVAQITDSN